MAPTSTTRALAPAVRRGLLVSGALLSSFVALMVPAQQATAITNNCTDGSRSQAEALAKRGGLVEKRTGWFDGPNYYTVALRYEPTSRCAWGWLNAADGGGPGRPGAHLWVDRSFDGGRTWQGLLGYQTLPAYNGWFSAAGSTRHTGAFNDGGVLMRACGFSNGSRVTRCTVWY